MPKARAIGRRSIRRSGPRSMNGSTKRRTMQTVGTPIVASGTSTAGLITRSSSNRKKKYHSGRGTYVVVVGSAFGPSSAPKISDMRMIATRTKTAISESFATAYGKNGFPFAFSCAYSRRYSSFWARFTSDLFLDELLVGLGLQPRGCGGAELGHQVEVCAEHRGDRAGV